MKQVLGMMRRADERFHMIGDGDKICVGVSGGKDSLLLMKALTLYQLFSHKRFTLIGVMLDLGLKAQNVQPIFDYARDIGVPFEVIATDIGKVVFDYKKGAPKTSTRSAGAYCALCAKLRRGALNRVARERGCNKVALGHNREDVMETLLLSLLYEGRFNTFAPVTMLERSGITVIRPLILLPEGHCLSMAKKLGLPVIPPNCDVAGHTKREETKRMLLAMQRHVPDLQQKILHALMGGHEFLHSWEAKTDD